MLNNQYLQEKREFYKNQLLKDIVLFWFPKSYDTEYRGAIC